MAERYKVEKGVLEQIIDGKGKHEKGDAAAGDSGANDADMLAKLTRFAAEINTIINSRKVEDVMLGSYDKARVDFEKSATAQGQRAAPPTTSRVQRQRQRPQAGVALIQLVAFHSTASPSTRSSCPPSAVLCCALLFFTVFLLLSDVCTRIS